MVEDEGCSVNHKFAGLNLSPCAIIGMAASVAAYFGATSEVLAGDKSSASTVKSDETVILFPTVAHLPKGADHWDVSLHGWIFEQRHFATLRDWWSNLSADDDELSEEIDDEDSREQATSMPTSGPDAKPRLRKRDILKKRSHYFLVDNERGKRIAIELAGDVFISDGSQPNGHFQGTARVERRVVESRRPNPKPGDAARDILIPIRVDLDDDDNRIFASDVYFLRDDGISVISDIDDTIKITECTSRRACTRNTFLLPFRTVPGMAELYADWARQGATIHYVSACPWQLYEPLRTFMAESGFPGGPMVMKTFRWKDRSIFDLFDSPEDFKLQHVGGIIERFPKRRFILVGDSGQSDPEAYGAIARRFPDAVKYVLIRDVGGTQERLRAAFRDVPPGRWQVFKDPSEIERTLLQLTATQPPARRQ